MFIKDHKKTALITGDKQISYQEVIAAIKAWSLLLQKGKGKRVAIFFENRPEWIYSFFAGWNCGAINVLIDVMCTQKEVEYILNDCQPEIIITSTKNINLLESAVKNINYQPEIINVDQIELSNQIKNLPEYTPAEDETVLMLYTSGTTGNSKGVMLSYKNIMKNVHWNNDAKRINNTDRIIAILPTHHSWPLIATVLCPLDCGATVVFLPKLDAQTLMTTLKEKQITMVTAVPRLFEMLHAGIMEKIKKNLIAVMLLNFCKLLYKIPGNRFLFGRSKAPYSMLDIIPLTRKIFKRVQKEFGGNIKTFISGGAKLEQHIIENFRAMGILMLEGYGLTETAPMVTYHPFDKIKIGSTGRVFDEIDICLGDENEILIKGPNVFTGYWNKAEDTRNAFTPDGYFKTGDLGYLDKQRYLYITGRKKDIIVLSNGKNIRPDLIEADLKATYGLLEDIAITFLKNQLVAVVIPDMKFARKNGISNINEAIKFDVIDDYNKNVENYKKIYNFIITTKEIPKTRMGKIQRYKLADFVEKNQRARDIKQLEIPQYEEYTIISDHLANIADVDVIPDDHIEIDLGLDSLELIEFHLFLEKTFGIQLQEGEIANFPSVEKLADYVKKTKKHIQKKGKIKI